MDEDEKQRVINEFFGDFDKWKSLICARRLLLETKSNKDEDLPPIRKVAHRKKTKENFLKNQPARISNANDDEKEVEIESSVTDSESDEDLDEEVRSRLSEMEKDEGNKLFREGKYTESIEKYTKSIGLFPQNPLLYTNRALALFKIERYASCEADCSTALCLEPRLVKALYRRAQARKAMDRLDEAISDLERILEIEPRNSAALKDLSTLKKEPKIRPDSNKDLYKLIYDAEIEHEANLHPVKISEVGKRLAVKSREKDAPSPAPNAKMMKLVDELPSLSQSSGNKGEVNQPKSLKLKSKVASPSNLESMQVVPKHPPANWYDFERDLRELIPRDGKLSPEAIEYLCSIKHQNYASVIGGNLTAFHLGILISAMANSNLGSTEIAERLMAIADLSRFSVAWMLSDDSARESVGILLEAMSDDLKGRLKDVYK